MTERAHSFLISVCRDPNCGPHITTFAEDSALICTMVWSPEQAREAVAAIQAILYERATERG